VSLLVRLYGSVEWEVESKFEWAVKHHDTQDYLWRFFQDLRFRLSAARFLCSGAALIDTLSTFALHTTALDCISANIRRIMLITTIIHPVDE